jgi:hypothetical protein
VRIRTGAGGLDVVEVVLPCGTGYTLRAFDVGEAEPPLLAQENRLLLFPTLDDLADFVRSDERHTFREHAAWPSLVESTDADELVAELVERYDLTALPHLTAGDAEDRWTASDLVTFAIDVAEAVGCPALEELADNDSAILLLEDDVPAFEGLRGASRRRLLADEVAQLWPRVLDDIERHARWWQLSGDGAPVRVEEADTVARMRLAAAEREVAEEWNDPDSDGRGGIPRDASYDPVSAPEQPAADFWGEVGAYPIELHLPTGVGVTLVAYLDDGGTRFLGTAGEVLLFRTLEGLGDYLRTRTGHLLADLPGWPLMHELRQLDLTPRGWYYLHDVHKRVLCDLDEEAYGELLDAGEMAHDLAVQLGLDEIVLALDDGGQLARLEDDLVHDPARARSEAPAVSATWERFSRAIAAAVTWDP